MVTPEQIAAQGQTAEQKVLNSGPGQFSSLSGQELNNINKKDFTTEVNAEQRTNSTTSEASAQETSTTPESSSTPKNLLHSFTNYTYRITLFLLTADDYKTLADSPSSFTPSKALISSGAGFSDIRHPDFLDEFYIENLSMTTVIGLNQKTKATNAIDINFTVVEPLGLSLLDRLMSATMFPDGPDGAYSGTANYIEQPYLLQIDFIADVGESTTTNVIDSKRIPIKILELKIKPTTAGTEYRVKAMPFNHSAFQQTTATVPINLSVTATTVGDYFDSTTTLNKLFNPDSQVDEERVESEYQKWLQTWDQEFPPTPDEINVQKDKIRSSIGYKVKSVVEGYNNYMSGVAKKGKQFTYPPTLINVIIDPIIAKAKIVDETKQEAKNTPLIDQKNSAAFTTTQTVNKADYKNEGVFNVHAGTDIPSLIDRVIQSSEYIKNQVEDFSKSVEENQQAQKESGTSGNNRDDSAKANKFLDWYKIIPQVYLGNFDPKSNAFSKVVCYSVVPYKNANAYHPDFKKTKVPVKKISREYNYLYTGLNQDIISVEIDFDSTYFTALGTFQKEKIRGKDFAGADVEVTDKNASTTVNKADPQNLPITIKPINNFQQDTVYKTNQDPKDYSVSSLSRSIYTSARGDMLNIKLKIIGDPAWIKQDDIYYNPMSPEYKTLAQTDDSSAPVNVQTNQILMDGEQVFVKFNILNVIDINDEIGIVNKQTLLSNGRYTNGSFSGLYKVVTVKSEFSKGKFEQVLDIIRMPDDLLASGENKVNQEKVNTTQTTPPDGTLDVPTNTSPVGLPSTQNDAAQIGSNSSTAELKNIASLPGVVATSPSEYTQISTPQLTTGFTI